MYTDSEEDLKFQKERAEAAIAITAKCYKSKKRRIEKLDYWRNFYGAWSLQITMDLLEEQMIAWGRTERAENMSLYASYTEKMNQYHVDNDKEEWTDEDRQHHAYFKVYARARYAIRFMRIADALSYLQENLDYWREYPQRPYALKHTPPEDVYWDAYLERLQFVIDEMRKLL